MHLVLCKGTHSLSVQVNSISELQDKVKQEYKISKPRQRLTTVDKKVITNTIEMLEDGSTVLVKDLGPQVSWKLVFVIEYFGPILIHLIGFSLSARTNFHYWIMYLNVLHYAKRELETLFVHRFSNATMPIMNLPKNCFHYWVLGGGLVAYELYGKDQTDIKYWYLVVVWVFAQTSNLITHIILMNLRPAGSTIRKIPKGYGFNLVTCPNYFFEILGWIIFSIMSGGKAAWFFTLVGAVQMYFWAVKKHQRYRKEFKDYPKRKVLIPFIL